MDTEDLSKLRVDELLTVFDPETNIERIAYRRNVGAQLATKRDFVVVKGTIGQAELHVENTNKLTLNEKVGFKCLHYSVTEGSGLVTITIVKECAE
jgi:hypothetical protein